MNKESTQQPKKAYSPLMASALLMIGLGNRFGKMVNGRTAGAPIPSMSIRNQRQKRKLAAQTR